MHAVEILRIFMGFGLQGLVEFFKGEVRCAEFAKAMFLQTDYFQDPD